MRGRPELFTSYARDQAPLNTPGKRAGLGLLLVALLVFPFSVTAELTALGAAALLSAVGRSASTWSSTYAQQISLGRPSSSASAPTPRPCSPATRTAAPSATASTWPSGCPPPGSSRPWSGCWSRRWRSGSRACTWPSSPWDFPVFIGEHLFRELTAVTGGPEMETGGPSCGCSGSTWAGAAKILGGYPITREIKLYLIALVVLVLLAVPAKNLARSAVGRAFAAVRDRDLAAEVMGVSLTRHKLIAFTISSFYAGIAGALLPTITGFIEPGSFNLLLSGPVLAMILIGGVAALSGSLLGAAFEAVPLPRLVEELPRFLPFVTSQSTGGVLTTFQLQTLLYGVLIVVFLIAEPRGAVRHLVRARNYWRAWPFSY